MSSIANWPRVIERFADVPAEFKSCYQYVDTEQETLPYTIYMPSDYWGKRITTEKLLYIYNRKVYLFEKLEDRIEMTFIPFNRIISIEHGKMLLYSWLKFSYAIEDRSKMIFIEYNSVTERIFRKVIDEVRKSYMNIEHIEGTEKNIHQLQDLMNQDYRFYNDAISGILPGQMVLDMIYQPEIRRKVYRIFSKRITPAHVTLLCEKEFIHIMEGVEKRGSLGKYCSIWTFIPLKLIDELKIERADESGDTVHLQISYGIEQSLKLIFSITNRSALERIIESFNLIKCYNNYDDYAYTYLNKETKG
ncbi:MAG: hypothetical protein ACOYVK_19885 [Bacillota bacterium]